MYEIKSKSDFQTGATLIVRIPEKEVDKKALYTILADKPDFILPFRHRAIDGEIEFIYQIGNRSKLAYLSGNRSVSEYTDLWSGILQPLLDCNDWFMNPYSFLFKTEYLYVDKNNSNVINFVYIPSVQNCSDYNMLKNMSTEIARQNRVTDINLENKVVWAIQDFNPNEFLQMLKSYKTSSNKQENIIQPVPKQQHTPVNPNPQVKNPPSNSSPTAISNNRDIDNTEKIQNIQRKSDDIHIDFSLKGKSADENKSSDKKKNKKEKKTLFGKKQPVQKEIIQGAALMHNQSNPPQNQSEINIYTPPESIDIDLTQLDSQDSNTPKFIYAGNGEHPKIIDVNIEMGEIFTIGRFDVSSGNKQSNFEFEPKTKAVSRRHAAIERNTNGYNLVDLSSSAGTFINRQKLPPNAPFKLERGHLVSFGYSGADYIWEE